MYGMNLISPHMCLILTLPYVALNLSLFSKNGTFCKDFVTRSTAQCTSNTVILRVVW